MADIPCGDNILEYLVVPAVKKLLRPIFCFQTVVGDFQDESKKLSTIQERVENDADHDRNNAQVINRSVEEWLKEVNEMMPKVEGMLKELSANNKSCFCCSWCPNWTCHYRFSKNVSETTATMKTLCANGDLFSSVSHPPTLHQDIIGPSSSVGFMHSHSSKSAFNQIMEALKSNDINLIGLYGGAGTGKTALAEQVAQAARNINIFRHVIMVPVSQIPLVRSIQGFITGFLGLSLDQLESEQAISAMLQLRLKGAKILIILDDVRKDINLGEVGILSVGCKLLLTAHAKVQVPSSVHTQRDVVLGTLSENEAWNLFERIADVGEEARMHGVAIDALAECCCLPKAIVAVGTTLNGKGVSEWIDTLREFKESKFRILNSLKEDAENLTLRREKVNTLIKIAKQNVHEIYPEVEKWLKDVERVLNDVDRFDTELNQNKWCFDEHDLPTKVEALQISIKDLYAKGNFNQVSHPTQLVQDMRLLSSQDFIFSKAAESAFSQMMGALKVDDVKMIGLYGMGGIGKTTLANKVQNEVLRQNIFTHSVIVTVSQKPDVRTMQDKIAEVLGFDELKEINTLDGRASKLCARLENENILIILDDVWKPFNMGTIGVALNNCKSCKILVTTRRMDVCSSMNCQSKTQLNLFSEDEALNFFKTKTGLSGEFELGDVAKQIVEECKCLPIALETVGAALKNKGKDEWTEALEKLRNARLVDIMGVEDDEKNAYRCVKVSYDYLKGPTQAQQAQFILLLCSLFPEDYEIKVEDLTRYAFGMELFGHVSSIEDTRRKVRVTMRFLKNSCLLLDIGGEEYVKMHDVVRDTVLWIGGTELQERKVLTVRDNKDLKNLIKEKSFQNCRAVSFMSDVIPKLSKYSMLECPNLEAVLIFTEGENVMLQEGFFQSMKSLKVLDIWGGEGWTRCKFAMPQSLDSLEYLRTLMLRYCECSNSCILMELRSLRILSLNGCQIDGGVEIVSGLKKLRLLDLLHLRADKRMFSSNVIERFTKLEELHGYTVVKCEHEEGTSNSLSELMLLSNLVALSVHLQDASCLPPSFYFPNVQSYYIRVDATNVLWPVNTRQDRRLELIGIIEDESVWISAYKKFLPTVQDLVFQQCRVLCSLDAFNSLSEGFLQRLESLVVDKCKRMEWMFQFQVHLEFLKILRLKSLKNLKDIWKGPTSLRNLTLLDIDSCKKLRCVFSSPSIATSMQQLEILRISSCSDLEEIISQKGGGGDFSCCCCFTNLRELQVSECGKVKTIFPIVKSKGKAPHLNLHPQGRCRLPKLQIISLHDNKELEHIFGHQIQAEEEVTVECPILQELVVIDCPNITTHFFATIQPQEAPSPMPLKTDSADNIQGLEQRRHDDLSHNTIVCSSTLKRVELRRCYKLKQVFTTSLVTSLCQLEELIVEECYELEQVISKVEDGKEEPTIIVCFENLKTLKVNKCGKLKTVFPITIALPKLERLELKSNEKLEHVFGQSDWDYNWQLLVDLYVSGCPKICTQWIQNLSTAEKEMKTAELGVEESSQHQSEGERDNLLTFPLRALALQNVEELKCVWRGSTRNIWFRYLVQIEVTGCNRLKHIFATPISTSLPCLERLTVQRCNELEQVIMVGVGKEDREVDAKAQLTGLENLQVLHVSDCEQLKTIFSIYVPLPKLDCLRLESNAELESLFGESDCDYTSHCHWTCLNELSLTGCPNLCTHSIAIVTSQLLQAHSTAKIINLSNIQGVEELIQFQMHDGDGDGVGDGDGDEDEDDSNGSDSDYCDHTEFHGLKLEEVGELKRIWSGPTQNIRFSFLVALRVIGCNRLKQLFTITMATTLHNLTVLSVERCHDLEKIVEKEEEEDGNEENNLHSLKPLYFSFLGFLRLLDLPKLISFCPSSCNLVLPRMAKKNIRIEGCPKSITDFFCQKTYGDSDNDNNDDEEDSDDDYKNEDEDEDDDNNHGRYSDKTKFELFGISSQGRWL